jgi:serine protease Do
MVKNATGVWYTGLTIALAVIVVLGLSSAVTAGSKDADKGYLGVYMQQLDKDISEGLNIEVDKGVLISGVESGGPADEAGLEDGDVIVEFAGKPVNDPDDLRDLARDTEPGEKVEVKVIRDGETKTITLTVGDWPEESSWFSMGDLHFDDQDFGSHINKMVYAFSGKPRLGVEITELNEDLAGYFKTKPGDGVLVLEVNEESVAEAAGVKSGDVILEVGEETVTTVDELRESLEDFEEGDEFPILVVRSGKKKTLTATMDETENVFHWSGDSQLHGYQNFIPKMHQFRVDTPHIEMMVDDDMREELDELKKELKEMKKELKELKK